MFSGSALSGYRYELSEGGCPCCIGRSRDPEILGDGAGRPYGSLTRDEVSRVVTWINLLRNIKFSMGKDAVLAYLYSTGMLGYEMLEGGVECCKETIGWPGYNSPDDGFQVYKTGGCGGDCCEGDIDVGDNNMSLAGIPKEIVTMATEYMYHRVLSFVNVIHENIGWSPDIHFGNMVPNTLINAVKSFTVTTRNDDDIDAKLKALHATLIPDYRSECHYWMSKHPSIKWDASNRTSQDGYGSTCGDASNGFSRMTADIYNYCYTIKNIVDTVYNRFCDALKDNDRSRASKYVETYCLGCEIVLYITCWTRGIPALDTIVKIPSIAAANMMFLDETVEKNDNPAIAKSYFDRASRRDLESIACLRKLTPEGAIVIGDLLDNNYSNLIHRLRYASSYLLVNYLNRMKGETYNCVAEFLIKEYKWQLSVWRDSEDRIRKLKGSTPQPASPCYCKEG